ncbi:MAG: hypothetical protein A3J27_13790 [Candidatus Tectomicrobia bacterium RIFCSPLOWO2_12_FULL_69_37]|nr:MAG: hypothetical protein A3I72_14835 [Candidatus Tectomicrobia bacterium RIFCSPLOWO2_02_FULL_70_19]OGL68399.1 MAG: hypothetical protein A3J27_13790 [Candidatus Tectomicrobia bacterium RIFCSPLOWO2_12_FULL_69_37]
MRGTADGLRLPGMGSLVFLAALLLASPAAADGIDLEPERAYGDALLLYGKGLASRAPVWRCEPARKLACGRAGCADERDRAWVALDFPRGAYRRCDRKGCETRPMTHRVSGMFTLIDLKDGGTFLRAVNDGSEYSEAVSEKDGVVLSFGACLPAGSALAP